MAKLKKKMLLPLILLITACESYITDINFDDVQLKLVLNGMISPDSIMVHLSRSMKINESMNELSDLTINNAEVTLFENDIKIGNLQYYETLYASGIQSYTIGYYTIKDFVPKEGVTYRVEAEAKGFPKINAENVIPSLPETIKIDTLTRYTNFGYGNEEIFEFIPEIMNYNGQKNYYAFSIPTRLDLSDWGYNYRGTFYTSSPVKIDFYSSWGYFNTTDELEISDKNGEYFFASDKGLSSEPFILKFYIQTYDLQYIGDILELNIDILDSGYYNHLLSLARWDESAGIDFFTEGVSIYSNVENGLGILGAKNSYRQEIVSNR